MAGKKRMANLVFSMTLEVMSKNIYDQLFCLLCPFF